MLLLVRGLPGTGKSTFGEMLGGSASFIHVEADQFFVGEDGVYRFDPLRLREAHGWCQAQASLHLELFKDVVVTNTFCQEWEVAPYREMAQRHDAVLCIVTMEHVYGNVHNVPEATIEKMRRRWEAGL